MLFWNTIFRFILEGYLEFAVDSFVNLSPVYMQRETLYDWVSIAFSSVFGIILLVLPFYILWFMQKRNEDELMNDKTLAD